MAPRKPPRSKREDNALKWRAVAAFVKYAQPGQLRASFDDLKGEVLESGGKLYVVLRSGKLQLAVFRVRNDDVLKRMRRPPRELRGEDE